jgi:hypothetical protein
MENIPTVIRVTDQNFADVLAADRLLLIVSRSDSGYCGAYHSRIAALQAHGALAGIRVGTILLDEPGVDQLKRDHLWLTRLGFLPYNVIYGAGHPLDGFAGSSPSYLLHRLRLAFAELA